MWKIKALLLIFMLVAIGCASNQPGEVYMEKTTFSFDTDKKPFDLFPEYRIQPGDVLDVLFQIRTWAKKDEYRLAIDNIIEIKFPSAPELNERQTVLPDGTISLPYIGSVNVYGKTVPEVTQELETRYKKVLRKPEVYVVVSEFRSAIKELKTDLHTAPRGLSRLVTVRPDGYVTFPMVGDVLVANRTILEVSAVLNGKYAEILPDLNCDLFLEKSAGSLIYVLGQVQRPGAYQIARHISLIEALTLAGSYLPGAQLNSIMVVRRHDDRMVATRVNLDD